MRNRPSIRSCLLVATAAAALFGLVFVAMVLPTVLLVHVEQPSRLISGASSPSSSVLSQRSHAITAGAAASEAELQRLRQLVAQQAAQLRELQESLAAKQTDGRPPRLRKSDGDNDSARGSGGNTNDAARRRAALPATAYAAAVALTQVLAFPAREYANPVRRAWRAGMLDWHDLVRPTREFSSAASAETAWRRHDREAAKATLIDQLQGFVAATTVKFGGVAGPLAGNPLLPGRGDAAAAVDAIDADINGDDVEAVIGPRRIPQPGMPLEYGPLAKYRACGVVRDACIIHATARACVDDELCGWCAAGQVCMSRFAVLKAELQAGRPAPACSDGGLWVTEASIPAHYGSRIAATTVYAAEADGSGGLRWEKRQAPTCGLVITRRRPIVIAAVGNAKMSYHFVTEQLPGIIGVFARGGGTKYLRNHIWVTPASEAAAEAVLHYLHLWSDSCWRYTSEAIVGPAMLAGAIHPLSSASAYAGETGASRYNNDSAPVAFARHSGPICYLYRPEDDASDGTDVSEAIASATVAPGTPEAEAVAEEALVKLVTGLPSPVLATVVPATGAPEGRSAHSDSLSLEPLLEATSRGMRLGVTGLAAMAATVLPQVIDRILCKGDTICTAPAADFTVPQRRLRAVMCSWIVEWQAQGREAADRGRDLLLAAPTAAIDLGKRIGDLGRSGGIQNVGASLLGLWTPVQELGPLSANKLDEKPLVTLISRRNKRFVMNEPQVVQALVANLHVDVAVAALEDLPLYSQLALLRRTRLLIGVHGSGLINSPMLPRGAALLQLVPQGLSNAGAFFQPAAAGARVHYSEWRAEATQAGTKFTFHWHFLPKTYGGEIDSFVKRGSDCCGSTVYFTFWINSDTVVDIPSFLGAAAQALNATERS